MTLEESYADADFVLRRYVTAVRDQGNTTPQLSAGLIGLSALALFKGVTGANSTDLAGAGVLGSAAWAYGNTTDSRPRRDVYRAGADALSCAMSAVEPLRKGQASLGKPLDGKSVASLYGRSASVREAMIDLVALREQHADLRSPLSVPKPAEPSKCTAETRAAPCQKVPESASAAERATLDAACKRLPPITEQRCTQPKPAGSLQIAANPEALKVFEQVDAELKAADQGVKAARRVIDTLEEAGPALWKKSVQIQIRVSEEVDKTIPNLASVLAAGQGMRSVAFGISGLDAFKPIPAVGSAQGGDASVRTLEAGSRTACSASASGRSGQRIGRVGSCRGAQDPE
jgi:hypothetical protein